MSTTTTAMQNAIPKGGIHFVTLPSLCVLKGVFCPMFSLVFFSRTTLGAGAHIKIPRSVLLQGSIYGSAHLGWETGERTNARSYSVLTTVL